MAKGKDVQKSVKKAPAKSMKEKKAEKVAKGNHLEIQAREESIFVKKKVGEKNG